MRPRRGDLRAALEPAFATLGVGTRPTWLDSNGMFGTLADDIAQVLQEEVSGMSCDTIARTLRRRKHDVLETLRSDPRFTHAGSRRGSRWRLAADDGRARARDQMGTNPGADSGNGSFDAARAAERLSAA